MPVAFGNALSTGQFRSTATADHSVVTGTDVLATFTVSGQTKGGRILTSTSVNPVLFSGTRISQTAALWTRWRPLSLTFEVQTALSTAAGGQLIFGWTPDFNARLPTNDVSLVRYVASLQPNMMFHGWEKATITPRAQPSQKWLFLTDQENQEDSHYGRIILVLMSPPSITSEYGVTVNLKWKVEFDSPHLAEEDLPSEMLQADEGYYPYFSTYSGHLPEGFTDRLTFEENSSGGYSSIVRFSDMKPDTVYAPVKSDAVQYYDKSGNLKDLPAIVRAKEVSDPFAWGFASEEDARSYIKSGGASKIIQWYKSGPWCTGNPLWKEVDSSVQQPLFSFKAPRSQQKSFAIKTDQVGFSGFRKEMAGVLVDVIKTLTSVKDNTKNPINVLVIDPVRRESSACADDCEVVDFERDPEG